MRLLIWMALAVGLLAPTLPAEAGDIVAASFDSATLKRAWPYEVYLPTGYATSNRRYPVIYLLHGNADDQTTWRVKANLGETADTLIAQGAMQPCILVMPGAGRSWYINGPDQMETAFINDLLPEIDHLYRTRTGRQSRMVAGLSMGGYGAMRLALRYPDRFSAVALMSPAIYSPLPPPSSSAVFAPTFQSGGNFDGERWRRMNYPSLLDDFVKSGWKLRVQLTAGLQDRLDTGTAAEKFAAAWRAHGLAADIAMYPGGHDFILWRQTLPLALHFLASPPQVAQVAGLRSPNVRR